MTAKALPLLLFICLPVLLCRCVTTEQASAKTPITVVGTLFYPDSLDQTYIIPAGAEIIGAGGNRCRYVVENGGKITAHTGSDNTYQIKQGGTFKGFAHPAKNCKIQYQNGAKIERLQAGSGVSYTMTN